ncbi:triose-phosphate isomerase [Caulobacter sp. 1776]|uniref:triose-phosphate isomerase n=1 Tax=Caulobacter sp. 1776 TaxID=3156420 RepID=UPI003397D3A1
MSVSKRPKLVVGNWKMNGLRRDLAELTAIGEIGTACAPVQVAVAMPSPLIYPAARAAPGLQVGAQDIHPESGGAFTGGVSAAMVRDAGGGFALVGHSERRLSCGETDAIVQAKASAARRDGLSAILCVGEEAAARGQGQAETIVGRQLEASLPSTGDGAWLSIAYEPIWAIGAGHTPTLVEIAAMHAVIRRHCVVRLGEVGRSVRLLYGGSVTGANAGAILGLADVDGVLVGGASLRAATFAPIVRAAIR